MNMQAQMRMPTASPISCGLLQRKCSCGGNADAGGECEACKKKKLQRSANQAGGPDVAPPIVHDVLRSPGQSLDATTRTYFEPRFGHDFKRISLRSSSEVQRSVLQVGSPDDAAERQADEIAGRVTRTDPTSSNALSPRHDLSRIRIHTGPAAAASARAVNARAYTVGNDVVFGEGQYAPHTCAGRTLLAHELTHTVQQQNGAGGLMQRKLGAIAKSGCDIVINMDIGIYGKRSTPALATTWQGWINSLWRGSRGCAPGKTGACSMRVESKVTAHPDINWFWNVPEANSAFVIDASGRSHVSSGVDSGDWRENADDKTIAHEVGHLMGEDDQYSQSGAGESKPGFKNDIMANYKADAGPTIYANALNRIANSHNIECQCCQAPAAAAPPAAGAKGN